ncbi:unnamed protein product [Fraxinus pennsylvanica]|uniref:Gnk2-homologous domain-containing protein n=1 Tax=Fraxinus pennsylvanica TaxID=56036 RepID=A0AAD2DRD8_9LAMI|nr:unnamed protein product [Fraxinus pennsylvanica]
MKKFIACQPVITFILVNLELPVPDATFGDPRAQIVHMVCGKQPSPNTSIFVATFVDTMEKISRQMQTSGYGMAVTSSGPDTNYALADCYGDLSLHECALCYAEARTILPQCFPSNGGRIFLDGCFMRAKNYSFFQEYTGPNDKVLCGNGSLNPTHGNGSLNPTQGNESLNPTQGNGSSNPTQGNGSSKGKITIIIVATVSSIAVLVIRAVVGVYIWKRKTTQKKNKEKLVKSLYDSCLNFKYSTLEKATGSFDEANKLGQCGFGKVSFQEDKSHISTAIAGTLGYMAPEYLARGQLTEKADVYSFGVLLIEIVTGRQNNRSKASEDSDSSLTLTYNAFKSPVDSQDAESH